jgi:hypothetical protein
MEKDYNAKPEYREGEHGKASCFKPFDKQKFIKSGKGWLEDTQHRYVLIEDTSGGGKKYIEVYQKVGTIFVNDKREEGSKQPHYTGKTIDDKLRIAGWINSSEKGVNISLSWTEARSMDTLDDEVPFGKELDTMAKDEAKKDGKEVEYDW